MKKEYFYVKPGDSFPSKLPEDLIYTIKIDDINTLALFATTLESESEIDLTFSTLMGDKVEPRREFIEEHAKFVKNLDI